MGAFLVSLVIGVIAFTVTWDAIHKPRTKRPKKRKPTIEDVWATIHSAQRTLDESRHLIYGDL